MRSWKNIFSNGDKRLSTFHIVFTLFMYSIGTSCILLPYLIGKIGVLPFFLLHTVITMMFVYSGCGFANAMNKLLTELGAASFLQDPYPTVVELAYGKRARRVLTVILSAQLLLFGIAIILLCSTITATLFHGNSLSNVNNIRIGIVVTSIIIFPLSLQGTYRELSFIGITGALTILAVVLLIQYESLYILLNDIQLPEIEVEAAQSSGNILLVLLIFFGTHMYTLIGVIVILPNFASTAERPERLNVAVISTYVILYIVMAISGVVPLLVFKEKLSPSIITTLAAVNANSFMQRAVILSIKVATFIHFLCAFLINVNPVYLLLEKLFVIDDGNFIFKVCKHIEILPIKARSGHLEVF